MRPVREAATRIREAIEDVTPMPPEPGGPDTARYRIAGYRDVVREIDVADLETVLRGTAS